MSGTQLKSKHVVTKKEHRCFGCMKRFPAGTKMLYEASVDNGDICSCYWCKDCNAILVKIDWNEYEDGIGFGELMECPEFEEYHKKQQP